MLRVDRNLEEKLSIPWQSNDSNFIQHLDSKDQQILRPPSSTDATRDRSSSLSPVPDTNSPQTQQEALSSPPLPPAAEEREEPVKVPQREEEEEEETRAERASRLSTPLSELSPPPDDFDISLDPVAHLNSGSDSKVPAEDQKKGIPSEGGSETIARGKATSDIGSHPSPSSDKKPPDGLTNIPAASTIDNPAARAAEHKIVTILELNSELFKVCMEFQKKGAALTDPLYQQYSQRLQSNLGWLTVIANPAHQGSNALPPIMDPPPAVDFCSCERIQQLYAEMPGFFAKDIARRQQLGISLAIPGSGSTQGLNPPQKRERTDDNLLDPASKRQNTGEVKLSPSQMMPPPSIPSIASAVTATNASLLPEGATQTASNFSLPISNGPTSLSPPSGIPQQLSRVSPDPNTPGTQVGMLQQPIINSQEAQRAASARPRPVQMRAAHPQQAVANAKHMPTNIPGSSGMSPQGVGQPIGMNPNVNGTPSPIGSASANAGHHMSAAQQAFQVLQNPNHPIMQHLIRAVPNFQSLPQQAQLQKIAMTAMSMQNRNQQSDPHRAGVPGIPNSQQGLSMQNNPGGMSSPMANPYSAQSASLAAVQQSNMFPAGIQAANPGAVGGSGGISGINVNNLTPQQRQFLLMQQQQRAGMNMGLGGAGMTATVGGATSGSAGQGMMVNPQQMALSQHQQHQQRQHQQQQQQQQQQRMSGGMGIGMGSPMMGGSTDFSAMRANNPIPGIARSTRSPSDGSSTPMTPRAANTVGRGGSLGPEDYHRMMIKQQQQGQNSQATAMFGSPGGGAAVTQGMMGGNWGSPGQQGVMGLSGQGQPHGQNPQLHGIQGMQNMQAIQGMQTIQGMQGTQMQGGYGLSSPTQPQQQPQQHQQAHQTMTGGSAGLAGVTFLGSGLSSSPPPMGISSPTWGGSPTQHQQQAQGMGGGMGTMFSPFSPAGGSLGNLSGHMGVNPQSQNSSLVGSQDDYSTIFDWASS